MLSSPPVRYWEDKWDICLVTEEVMRALEKDPMKRFPSVKQFADDFAWAYKVAQAKKELPYPTTSPLKQVTQVHEMQPSLIVPVTPPLVPAQPVQAPQPAKRQFLSPL